MATTGLDLLKAMAARLRYKLGCRFGVDTASGDRALIWLGAPSLPDVDGAGRIGLRIYHAVQPAAVHTAADALQAFAVLVSKFELHEAAEFLSVDGRQVFLPHRAGAEHGGFEWPDFQALSGRWMQPVAAWLENGAPAAQATVAVQLFDDGSPGVILVQPPAAVALTDPGRPPFTGAHFAQQDFVRGLLDCVDFGEVLLHATGAAGGAWKAALASTGAGGGRVAVVDLQRLRARRRDAPTVLLVPHADLTPALQIRHLLGDPPWPVIGLTHDLSDPTVFRGLALAHAAGLRSGDALVCCSTAAAAAARQLSAQARWLVGRSEESLSFPVVPHGIDTRLHTRLDGPASARRTLGLASGECVFLAFGRIHHGSKADLLGLVVAFGQSRFAGPARLVVAGASEATDGELAELQRAVRAAAPAGSVVFVPNPDAATKQRLFSAADVFVSPAHSLQESFGLTLVEAMLHELPVVASDWNGYRDIVVDGHTGLLVRTEFADVAPDDWHEAQIGPRSEFHAAHTAFVRIDFDAFAAALLRLEADPDLRARFGANGRRRALECHDIRVTIQLHRAVCAESIRLAACTDAGTAASRPAFPALHTAFAGHAGAGGGQGRR